MDDRYDRQQRIEGWNQDRLRRGSALIKGCGTMGYEVVESLVGMGVGTVLLVDQTRKERFNPYFFFGIKSRPSPDKIARVMNQINDSVLVLPLRWDITHHSITAFAREVDVVVDVTNNAPSLEQSIQMAKQLSVPLVMGACDQFSGVMRTYRSGEASLTDFEPFFGKEQGFLPSRLIGGGIIAEDVRKVFVSYSNTESFLEEGFRYNTQSHTRRGSHDDFTLSQDLSQVRVMVVGNGALGCAVAPILARYNPLAMYLMDHGTIEPSNLSRQPLYTQHVGSFKSTVLKNRLKRVLAEERLVALPKKLVYPHEKDGDTTMVLEDLISDEPSIWLDCLDNLRTRVLLNQHRVPTVSGGSTYHGGQVVSSFAGTTYCLNCVLDIEEPALYEVDATHCTYVPEPSIITTSKVIGALQAGEVLAYANQEQGARVINGGIFYDLNETTNPLAVRNLNGACRCYLP